jgi:hypothetical protein
MRLLIKHNKQQQRLPQTVINAFARRLVKVVAVLPQLSVAVAGSYATGFCVELVLMTSWTRANAEFREILGHSAKMSFYSGILYTKFFDCGVSLHFDESHYQVQKCPKKLRQLTIVNRESPEGHSAKMSIYSGILYAKFFDCGVSQASPTNNE